MPDPRKPTDPHTSQPAGRSADARGDTGADADRLASGTGATGDTRLGGIPSTTDTALSPSMSGSADLTSDGPLERDRPAGADTAQPAPAGADRPQAGTARRKRPRNAGQDEDRVGNEGPLESLGRAVSAPVRQTADPSEDEKPR